jgi:serine/threonine protein kinase
MCEVYQAHDSKLGRDVAIKVLPEQFARDPERLARFEREAKLLAFPESSQHRHDSWVGAIRQHALDRRAGPC